MERVFPLLSPNVAKVERIRAGQVRRAKLYYLRGLTGKSARIKEELSDKLKNNDVTAEQPKAAEPVVEETPQPEPEKKVEETTEEAVEETSEEKTE